MKTIDDFNLNEIRDVVVNHPDTPGDYKVILNSGGSVTCKGDYFKDKRFWKGRKK